jgi:drug/metabolite transporter (DMT)-like permease
MLHRIMTASASLTIPQSLKHSTTLGLLCGVGAAFCWALGFVIARQGVLAGMSPVVVAMHRFLWAGLALLPFVAANGFRDLGGIGWGRGFALALVGGLPLALWSYIGFLFVPLGHGGVIQPSSAALGGMLLARLVLKEPLPPRRVAGGIAIVAGLCIIGLEALRTIGGHGIGGDLLFVAAGASFATFGILVRLWRQCAQ